MGDVQGASRSQIPAAVSANQQSLTRVSGRWLRWQCQLLSSVRFGAVVDLTGLGTGAGIRSQMLITSIGTAAVPLIVVGDPNSYHQNSAMGVTYWQVPVKIPGKSLCVLLHVSELNEQERLAADRLLRWGVLNFTDWLADAQVVAAQSLPPLRLMLSHKNLEQSAARWVDDLQFRTQASRISVAWDEGGRTRLLAISGVPALDIRRALPRALTGALVESMQAEKIIRYPNKVPSAIDLIKHQQLHECHGEHHILSLPLEHNSVCVGSLLLEFDSDNEELFDVESLQQEVTMAVPVLVTLSDTKPGILSSFRRILNRCHQRLFKPDTQRQKIAALATFGFLLLALLFPFPQHASVQGKIQGADRQVLAATHAGYLLSASARAGDPVRAGQVLAQFDHTRMNLERDTWVSELTRLDAALVQAMSARDRSAIGRLRAEQAAASAELELMDHHINESDIIAPFDGILVSGDLDDRLGSSVSAGEALFQIASLNDYTLQLDVPEQLAADVSQGSEGKMRFAAFPSKAYDFSVDTLVPVAIPQEGANVFRMRAALNGDTSQIRPGMTGVAKISIGQRSLISRSLDLLRHRLRYWWWSFGA